MIGFIGRRSSSNADDDYASANHLNTRTFPVSSKGEALFGYAENRERLAAGGDCCTNW